MFALLECRYKYISMPMMDCAPVGGNSDGCVGVFIYDVTFTASCHHQVMASKALDFKVWHLSIHETCNVEHMYMYLKYSHCKNQLPGGTRRRSVARRQRCQHNHSTRCCRHVQGPHSQGTPGGRWGCQGIPARDTRGTRSLKWRIRYLGWYLVCEIHLKIFGDYSP